MSRPLCTALLVAALLAGCGGESLPDPSTLPLPDPDLSQMEPTLREGLRRDQEQIFARARDGETPPAEVAEAFGELGQVYHTYELWEAALVSYDNAARLLPEDPRWPYLTARIHQHVGRFEEAEAGFRRTLELAPGDLATLLRLGEVYLLQSRFGPARELFEQALEASPGTAAAHFGLGRVLAATGEPAAAAERFEEALRLEPDSTVIHYPLSQAYRRLGRLEDARRHLELRGQESVLVPDPLNDRLRDIQVLTALRVLQVLAAEPGDVAPEELLGFAVSKLGNVGGTIEQLEKDVAALPAEVPELARRRSLLHYVLGGLEVFRGRDDRAVERFRAALTAEPGLADARIKLANALARTGRLEEAVAEYERAIADHPGDADLVLKQATALLNLRRAGEARALLERLVAEKPGHAVAHVRLAELLEASGQPERARAAFSRALEIEMVEREKARVHRGLAGFHRRRGALAEAVAELRRAVELDRTYISARLELAGLLGAGDRFDDAASEYRTVIGEAPKNAEARYGEAAALILGDRRAEAVQRLREAIAMVPEESGLVHLLARLLAAAPEEGVRDGERALELALEAHREAPGPETAETVAMAYGELGEFDRATEWQRRALAGGARPDREARLALFEAGRAYRAGSPYELLVERRPG